MNKQNLWQSAFGELWRWMRAHPLKALCFTVAFLACGALWAEVEWPMAAGFTFGTWLVFELCVRVDLRRMVALALAAALLTTPLHAAEAEPQPAPIVGRAVAVVVIVGGGWVIVKLRNFCKRHFPRGQTNAPPQEFQVAGEVGEYGALFNYELAGSCEVQAERGVVGSQPQRPVPTVFTLAIIAESTTNVSVTMRADVGEQFVQDVTGWSEEMASHGLFTFGHETASYERNRHPCDAEQVPIKFDPDTRTVTLEPGGIVVTVEHSADLRQWEPLLIINVAQGTRLLVPDASEGMAFYRVSVKEP